MKCWLNIKLCHVGVIAQIHSSVLYEVISVIIDHSLQIIDYDFIYVFLTSIGHSKYQVQDGPLWYWKWHLKWLDIIIIAPIKLHVYVWCNKIGQYFITIK